MLIASIYTACRLICIPITFNDLLEFTSIDKKKITRCYRLIVNELNINIKASSSINFIARFCAELKLSSSLQNKAIEILMLAEKLQIITGRFYYKIIEITHL